MLTTARSGAGRLLVPTSTGAADSLVGRAGVDLLAEVPAVADWLAGLDGRLLVGNYLYADGGTHVRVSVAADALAARVAAARPDTALGFLATPTDVFVVPRDAVEHSARVRRAHGGRQDARSPVALGHAGPAAAAGLPGRRRPRHRRQPRAAQQGPNYALAKRIQRWRATTARHEGRQVSFHVAPSTRTRSVVKNRALAAAFAGAHRFGVEVFDPDTANTLMAALLVHDLSAESVVHAHPWQDEAYAAVHGGLWRAAYEPRSALGLAAVLGYASARA